MRLSRYLSLLTTCTLLFLGARVYAQAAIPSSAPGVRLGDTMVLHMSLGTELGWDSNVFYQASNEASSFYLRLTPGFDLTNRPRLEGQRAIQFDVHGGLNYVEYLSSNAEIVSHRQFNVDAGAQASFFSYSPYNFSVLDNYERSTQPPYNASSSNYDRDTNQVGARVSLSPGGGRLTVMADYFFGIDYFEQDPLTEFDMQSHQFDLRVSWRFLPKTAVYIAANEYIYHYVNTGIDPTLAHSDSYPLRIDAGLQGLITTKLTVNLWIGYGNGFYVTGPSPNTAVGGLNLTWKPTMLSTGTIGYQHDFQNSLLGSYFDEDMAFISWTQLIWRFTGAVRFQYSNQRYNGVMPAQATTDGTDNYVEASVRIDYPFMRWLFASAGYDLYLNRSNRTILGPTPLGVPVDYTRNVVYLRLTASY